MNEIIRNRYDIPANDLSKAGEASSCVKKMLVQMGVAPNVIKKVAIAMYETEINAVIHGGGGFVDVEIHSDKIEIRVCDEGPGILDIDLAMKVGYSTATDKIREMGFGAGMGLPNAKKNADVLKITSKPGIETIVSITVNFNLGD